MLPPIDPRAQQQVQQRLNTLITTPQGQISTYPFPPNLAGTIPKEMRQKIYLFILQKYIWPQVQQRKAYEHEWDNLLEMARASLKMKSEIFMPDTKLEKRRLENLKRLDHLSNSPSDSGANLNTRLEISDTVVFDAIDRLTNLNHFITFKEALPVQYSMPEDVIYPNENEVYSPMSDMVRSANAWLKFVARSQNVYRKGWITARHHYTYGVSFVNSEFIQKIEMVPTRMPDGSFQPQPQLTEIGTSFEPISLRKLWLNAELSIYDMKYQPCPFFFDVVPRFAIVANPYDPQLAPFGFANLDSIPTATYLFGNAETDSWMKGMKERNETIDPTSIMDPRYNAELLWTLYPMLPIGSDPSAQSQDNPQGLVFDEDGTQGIPMSRFIVQMFGNQLCNGGQEIIRLQRNFYPQDSLPLYGSAQMPTLDDGAYPMAIGAILKDSYTQICKALLQYTDNKDLINDPPVMITQNSPAMSADLNKKGARIPVLTQNDIRERTIPDGTQSTPAYLKYLTDKAKTTSKATEAILGQAMGSRTSATEAQNAFQTAMSGVTTDVNMFSHDIYGGFAERNWDYTGRWVDPDILQAITGSYGFALRPEHMAIRIGLTWDVGSQFIEKVTNQQNIRYMLESSANDPSINRAALWKMLMRLWGMKDIDEIVNDQGLESQIQMATDQAICTYLGQFVIIDPDQDHQLAIKVKKSFLQDRRSKWNTDPATVIYAQKLVQQIQQHQLFLQQQMLMQQLQQQRMMLQTAKDDPTQSLQSLQNDKPSVTTSGQQSQQEGGTLS